MRRTLAGKSHNYCYVSVFEKLSFIFFFFAHTKTLASAFKFLPFEEQVFEKHRFRDGLVRAVSLTVERKLRFQDLFIVVWTGGALGLRFFSQIEVKLNDSLARRLLDTKRY